MCNGPIDPDDLRRLADITEIDATFAELHRQAERRVRVVSPGESVFTASGNAARIRRQTLARKGDEMAMFSHRAAPSGEFRVREHLLFRMIHVDDRIAAISAVGQGAPAAFVIRSPLLLELLAEWFDLLWSAPGTVTPSDPLTVIQRRILALLPEHGDEAIARLLGISATTVRRHVKAIYEKFGVANRFAAGVAAAKHGWL
ncbi:hypothetical protein BS329_07625 [Amycolatopsis coloradensis]|uniref:HTH luxR-type domain-containing protein n=2 Tax=Amycolatopsis coloradensis TaxID=76021 RepID=A0A1R0KYG9_9PSEU|nr:hypothetical protein BS329_07625 [Amycolatopsis coloradensis]